MTDSRIHQLLEDLMESGRTPEEVCRAHPELLLEVQERWRRVRLLIEEVETVFPAAGSEQGRNLDDLTPPHRWGESPTVPGYEVLEVLGRGGMGVVYKARHQRLNRVVAIKMLVSGEYASTREVQRLLLESEVLASLRHPNIVQVFDVGDLDGRPYFTMEFLEGGTLAQSLAGCPRPAREAAALLVTLARAVQAVHDAGIVHRDLKPSNVLLAADGTPKVADCGVARRLAGSPGITVSGVRVGTPSYMAPEQAVGGAGAAAPAVDVYALGAILYEVLTGRPPFRSETPEETARQLLIEEPVPPFRLNPTVPRDLDTICLKSLSKDPQRRYATASALADDLHRYLTGEPIAARRAGSLERMVKWVRRRPSRAVALAASVLIVLSLAGATLWVGWQRAVIARAVDEDLRQVADLKRSSDWVSARAALERAKGRLGEGGAARLRQRIDQAEADLALVAALDDIQLSRAAFRGTGIDMADAQTSLEYRAAFQQAGLWDGGGMAAAAAADKVLRSNVRDAILGALDEWSTCDPGLEDWLLQVALLVDPDPWRSLVRDAAALGDRSRLEELAANAPVGTQPVRLLVALSRRLRAAGADAVPLLRRVQRVHPDDLWANFELGSALIDSESSEALSYLRAAVALRTDAAPIHYNLGQALRGMKRFDEAMHEYECVLKITPGHRWSIVNVGVCLHHMGQPAEAIGWYRRALEIEPVDFRTRTNLGIALQSLRRLDEAIVELREAVRIDPSVALLHNNLGAALVEANDAAGAIAAYEETVRLDPRHDLAHLNLGRLLRTAGRLREASEHFRAAAEIGPQNFAARRDLRGVLMRLGESDRVRDDWRTELAGLPVEHEAWDGYAELCLFLGSPSDYHEACRTLLARFGTTTDPYIAERTSRACLLLPASEDEIGSAAALVDVALNADKTRYADWAPPFFHFAKALAEYRQGHFDVAIAIMEEEASTVLGPAPRLVIAMAQHQLGRTQEARRTLAVAVMSIDWRRPNADIRDAWMYHILRREAEAAILPDLPAFLEGRYQPRDNDERFALQGICQFDGRFAASAQLYADAFAADPPLADDLRNGLRYNAACAAALAGRGTGQDGQAWREQARQWLIADARSLRAVSQDRQARQQVRDILAHWIADPDLAGIRDPEDLAKWPEGERAQCAALWAQVSELQQACQDVK